MLNSYYHSILGNKFKVKTITELFVNYEKAFRRDSLLLEAIDNCLGDLPRKEREMFFDTLEEVGLEICDDASKSAEKLIESLKNRIEKLEKKIKDKDELIEKISNILPD